MHAISKMISLQCVLCGSSAKLEVLKFAEEKYSFVWTKVGSRCQITPSAEPNVLTFKSVSEENFGYYWCEVKEAERVILTVYRALYRDLSISHLQPGMFHVVMVLAALICFS